MSKENHWNFDEWAGQYDEIITTDKKLFARYNDVLDRVVEVADVTYNKKVLDIGTGTGNLALRCILKGSSVIGIDPSAPMLAKARRKFARNADVKFRKVLDPFLKIPYPKDYFDAVISTYAFHHIPHRKKPKCIKEMVRVIKPGGAWALGDLVFKSKAKEQDALKRYDWLDADEYFERIDELQKVFKKLGMKLNAEQFTSVIWVLWAVKP